MRTLADRKEKGRLKVKSAFLIFSSKADLEKSIVSVERIQEYQKTPVEAPFEIQENDPPPNW